ncbi:11641_t:CDS:2 [Entrophospora sp. SA101]|nr:1939_t:CDS:2 [Entrophospora sp. SA101]CAJ0855336.1 11641_t:CDS:2 [Entrophospora sp. SA101]
MSFLTKLIMPMTFSTKINNLRSRLTIGSTMFNNNNQYGLNGYSMISRGMKVRSSVKKFCDGCSTVKRRDRNGNNLNL